MHSCGAGAFPELRFLIVPALDSPATMCFEVESIQWRRFVGVPRLLGNSQRAAYLGVPEPHFPMMRSKTAGPMRTATLLAGIYDSLRAEAGDASNRLYPKLHVPRERFFFLLLLFLGLGLRLVGGSRYVLAGRGGHPET